MWWALEKHKVPAKYITLIKDMYDNVVTSVRTSDGDTDDFPIKIVLGNVAWEVISVAITCSNTCHNIIVHVLDEGNVVCWDFVR